MKALSFWFTMTMLTCLCQVTFETKLPPLPDLAEMGISKAYVDCVNTTGLIVHILHSGCDESRSKPLVILLHGFPEMAYTWKFVIPGLAAEGYCVVAPDRRGCGRTTGWDTRPYAQVDLTEFSRTNAVRDLVALVYALGYTKTMSIIGADFGAVVAEWAALIRPDMFTSSVHITYPFGPPPLPTRPAPSYSFEPVKTTTIQPSEMDKTEADLERLRPPRKYYQLFMGGPDASNDWLTGGALGLHQFLRRFFYVKSGDWPENHPRPLPSDTAEELAVIPLYYIMLNNQTMSQTVATLTEGFDTSSSKAWFPDSFLNLYADEYLRVGIQGGLNFYRILTASSTVNHEDAWLMSGRKIEGPVIFIDGDKDWGRFMNPGALENYNQVCTDYRGQYIIPNCGHWVQLEQPQILTELLIGFLKQLGH